MRLSKQAIAELQAIYREEYGEELTEAEAEEMGTRLVHLLSVLSRPLPGDGRGRSAYGKRGVARGG